MMGGIKQFYQGGRWRIGRLGLGILVVVIITSTGASSVLRPILLSLAAALILSAVPWERLPWNDIVANMQQQKMSFDMTASHLMRAQKQDYADRLSSRVAELTANTEMEKVSVIFELSNNLFWDLTVVELRGSAKLDAQTISQDLSLSEPVSSYRLKRLRSGKIKVSFPTGAGVINQLNDKREQEETAYWGFDLAWKLKFSSGEEVVWKPEETQFEAVPSIEQSQNSG
jgi:hypothetical protein